MGVIKYHFLKITFFTIHIFWHFFSNLKTEVTLLSFFWYKVVCLYLYMFIMHAVNPLSSFKITKTMFSI